MSATLTVPAGPAAPDAPALPTLPGVAAVEDLPDGRRLVVFADGRQVVVGRAGPRPHPVRGCEWLGAHPAGLVRTRRSRRPAPRGTPRTGTPRTGTPRTGTPRTGSIWSGPSPGVAARARALLESLLDPSQRSDFRTNGGFWVDTPRGPVRLGRLYHLVHRPLDEPGIERILCVVPDRHAELPIDDIWSNLLLVLAVEPDVFFRVAVLRGARRRATRQSC